LAKAGLRTRPGDESAWQAHWPDLAVRARVLLRAAQLLKKVPEPYEVGRWHAAKRGWRAGDDVPRCPRGVVPAGGQFHWLAPAIAIVARAREKPESLQFIGDDCRVRRVDAELLRELGECQRPASQAHESPDPPGAPSKTERPAQLVAWIVAADEVRHDLPCRPGEIVICRSPGAGGTSGAWQGISSASRGLSWRPHARPASQAAIPWPAPAGTRLVVIVLSL
jgi:hypothetical protein